ncbi:hypothetical protein Tco_0477698 [Tanacetum coccineum]
MQKPKLSAEEEAQTTYVHNKFNSKVNDDSIQVEKVTDKGNKRLNDDVIPVKKAMDNGKTKMVEDDHPVKKHVRRNTGIVIEENVNPSVVDIVTDSETDLDVGIDFTLYSDSDKESIDSGFARFNTIITSLKALIEGFSSKNYVRKFLKALHPKWRAKITAIEESKDLSSLALDELIDNLKVHEVVIEKDSKIYRGKKERIKSIALKAKKETSDDETSTSESDDEEYVMAVRDFKKFFRRKGKIVSDSKIGAEKKTNDETCLMVQSSNEVTLNSSYYSDNASSLDSDTMQIEYDSLCEISLKIINKNKTLKTKRDLLEKEVLELNEKIKKLQRSKEIDIASKLCQELKLENARLKETQAKFVKFDKSANSLR